MERQFVTWYGKCPLCSSMNSVPNPTYWDSQIKYVPCNNHDCELDTFLLNSWDVMRIESTTTVFRLVELSRWIGIDAIRAASLGDYRTNDCPICRRNIIRIDENLQKCEKCGYFAPLDCQLWRTIVARNHQPRCSSCHESYPALTLSSNGVPYWRCTNRGGRGCPGMTWGDCYICNARIRYDSRDEEYVCTNYPGSCFFVRSQAAEELKLYHWRNRKTFKSSTRLQRQSKSVLFDSDDPDNYDSDSWNGMARDWGWSSWEAFDDSRE